MYSVHFEQTFCSIMFGRRYYHHFSFTVRGQMQVVNEVQYFGYTSNYQLLASSHRMAADYVLTCIYV